MRKIVLVFGLIAGAIMSAFMLVSMLFVHQIDSSRGLIIGYTSMVLAFLLVYFGVRSYRDNVAGGTIGFGRAFGVGITITLIACACYVATWEVVYHEMIPDYMTKYTAHQIEHARASGASQAQIDAKVRDAQKLNEMYKNPFIFIALTFIEPFPVGLLFTLVSAALLRGRRNVVGATSRVSRDAMI